MILRDLDNQGGKMKIIEKLKKFCCRIGWHGPKEYGGFDGASFIARCKWCKKVGLVDSQGNLFGFELFKVNENEDNIN